MHRIDTSTAQIDKFGQGKNGFTNGDPATGRRATYLNSDMWDAVQEEICGVIEGAQITLDKQNYNQLYIAIKKIISGEIPDALLKKNNLSDVANKAVALGNINGVPKTTTVNGHYLNSDVVVTSQDIFDKYAISIPNNSDLNTYKTAGIYFQATTASAQSGSNYPEALAGTLVVYKNASPGATQVYYVYNTSRVYTRGQYSTGEWSPWAKQYNNQNKPSPAELGVLPTGGGVMTGQITVSGTGRGSYATQLNSGAPLLQTINASATSEYWPMIKQRYAQGNTAWSIGTLVNTNDLSVHFINADGSGAMYAFRKDGQFVPQNYANFDSRYQAKGSYGKPNSASKAANGWWKCGDTGVIRQWGTVAVADNQVVTANFPIAFPSACTSLVVTVKSQAGNSADQVMSAYGIAISNSQMRVSISTNFVASSSGICFMAEGY